MTSHLRSAATIGVWLLLGAAVAIAGTNIKTDKDPKFDFAKLKTWAWNPSPGDVKIWVSVDSNQRAEPAKRKYEPTLMQAVEDNLALRGYTKASGTAADFHVTYYVLVTMSNSSQQMGQFLPTNAQWGIPLYSPNTTAMEIYPQGSIVLDMSSPTVNNVIWRGIAQAKVEATNSDDEREKRVKDIVKDLVAKFPKKK